MSERKSTRVKTVAKALKRVDEDTRRQVRRSSPSLAPRPSLPPPSRSPCRRPRPLRTLPHASTLPPIPRQVAAARLDALENDNADAEAGGDDDSEYEIEDSEGTCPEQTRGSRDPIRDRVERSRRRRDPPSARSTPL